MHAIHNARVQLFATALNTLGIGAIISGVVVPEVNGAAPAASAVHMLLWLALGIDLTALAQSRLGRLR